MIEAYVKNARQPTAATAHDARENRDVLLDDTKRDPVRFRIAVTRDMGHNRKAGGRTPGFIDSTQQLIESFYGDIVQHLTPWTPKAPQITAPAVAPASDDEGQSDVDSIRQYSPFRFGS